MRIIYVCLFSMLIYSCNRGVVDDVGVKQNVYNNALSSCVDYIISNDLLKGENDTMYFNPIIRIDTNSILTYGVVNSNFYYSYIDTVYGVKTDMTPERYYYYNNIKEMRTYSDQHDFSNASFSIPVETVSYSETSKRQVRPFHINIASPLIHFKDDSYEIWISKYLEPFNNNYGLML